MTLLLLQPIFIDILRISLERTLLDYIIISLQSSRTLSEFIKLLLRVLGLFLII